MKQLYFYNNDGDVYFDTAYIESYNTLGIEIPEGKRLVKIDTSKTPHEPIFENIPPSEMESRVEALELTMASLMGGM